MSEQELLERCRKGNVEAFEQLIEAYQGKILNYCFRMLGNRSDAEDAAQEVFVKVYRFIGSFTGQSSFSTWLYKVASNVCFDILRKRKRRGGESLSLQQYTAEGEEFDLPLEDDSYSPDRSFQRTEAQRVLKEALEKLSPEHRRVIILRDIEGLSYEEIAGIVGTAAGTVKSRINRARQILQKLLENNRELFLS